MTAVEIVRQIVLPLSLAVIMLGMGMSLTPKDFTRIVRQPKAIVIGLVNQLLLLPLVGFLLAIAFGLSPVMAVGLMILAACPGGVTSNLITQVSKGNIALSVSLTAIASVVSIVSIPFILTNAIDYFGADSDLVIELPVLDTILQIMAITVIPISIGMTIRHFRTAFAVRMERPMRIASTVLFVLVFLAVVAANREILITAMKEVGIVTLVLNVVTMAMGYFAARLFRLDLKNSISITIESGIQNGTLAIVIATTVLNNIEMGIPTGAYAIWMFLTGAILMWRLGSRTGGE